MSSTSGKGYHSISSVINVISETFTLTALTSFSSSHTTRALISKKRAQALPLHLNVLLYLGTTSHSEMEPKSELKQRKTEPGETISSNLAVELIARVPFTCLQTLKTVPHRQQSHSAAVRASHIA